MSKEDQILENFEVEELEKRYEMGWIEYVPYPNEQQR